MERLLNRLMVGAVGVGAALTLASSAVYTGMLAPALFGTIGVVLFHNAWLTTLC